MAQQRWREADRLANKEGPRRAVVLPGAHGGTYTGEWKANKMHGRGERVWTSAKDGSELVYNGEFAEGQREGQGTLFRAARPGDARTLVYEGGWHADRMHGVGTWHLPSGDVYRGELERGVRQGQGTLRFANGDVYEGAFFAGLPEGTGTLLLANGDRFTGEWAHGKRHGRGEYYFAARGKLLRGVWADGNAACGEMVDETDAAVSAVQQQSGQQKLPELELRDPAASLEEAEERVFTTLVDDQSAGDFCDFIDAS